jgi:hypothetical protein
MFGWFFDLSKDHCFQVVGKMGFLFFCFSKNQSTSKVSGREGQFFAAYFFRENQLVV